MRVFSYSTLRNFWAVHADAEAPLRIWYRQARQADWRSPADVRALHASASIIAGNRVVFNIKGNDYRLVVNIDYLRRTIFIRFIGTHSEYDRINVAEV